jgi:hypothetical protein
MSPSQSARASRKREIPRNFILNWQCPGTQGAKPLVRRPMTACEACRIAKVKCNGQQECDRCNSRGIYCRYTTPAKGHADRSRRNTLDTSSNASTPPSQTAPEQISMVQTIDSTDPFSIDNVAYEQTPDNVVDWPKEMVNQVANQLDWSHLDINLNVSEQD